jgi:Protein of unknown function (DUF3710)
MVFRRRRETDDLQDQEDPEGLDDIFDDDDDDEAAVAQPLEDVELADELPDVSPLPATASSTDSYAVVVPPRPTGPWDFHDVPKDDEIPRIDLGGLLVPIPDGMEIRVEVQDEIPVAASLIDGHSSLQIHAFAAPKSSSLWTEIRREIAESLTTSGGNAEDVEGPFGTELKARIPTEGALTTARFLGVDGPRWFLRGLMTGAGSTDPNQAKGLEAAFRQVVVNRGTDAMAPRDMLPLHLPREALEAAPVPEPEAPDYSLQLPERGPEITEIQ